MKLLALSIRNLELALNKYENMLSKLRITSSVIVTDIPIKTQQYPTSSF